MKRRITISFAALLISNAAYSATDCGAVQITDMLSNSSYGSLMRVSNTSCGKQGWVCLDPNGEKMSPTISQRAYAFILTSYTQKANVQVSTAGANNVYVAGCGGAANGFPVIEDVRSAQ